MSGSTDPWHRDYIPHDDRSESLAHRVWRVMFGPSDPPPEDCNYSALKARALQAGSVVRLMPGETFDQRVKAIVSTLNPGTR